MCMHTGNYDDCPECRELTELRAKVEDADSIMKDFSKCYDLAQRMASMFPEHPGVWTGSVSKRLTLLFSLLVPKED